MEGKGYGNIQALNLKQLDYFVYIKPLEISYPSYLANPNYDSNVIKPILAELRSLGYSIIFTDGSKSEERCGCAVYDSTSNKKYLYKFQNYCTIYSAEAHAILQALKYCRVNQIQRIAIMSDSCSVLQALETKKPPLKTNSVILECINQIADLLGTGYALKFYWVKSHSGIQGNEVADTLAKRSIAEGELIKNLVTGDDMTVMIKKEILHKAWNQHWCRSYASKSTQYALIHPEVNCKCWFTDRTISRKFYTMIARMKFGHGKFRSHLHRLGISDTPICSCGTGTEDLNHIFLRCPLYETQITKLIKSLTALKVPLPTDIISVLATNDYDIYKILFEYIQTIKKNL